MKTYRIGSALLAASLATADSHHHQPHPKRAAATDPVRIKSSGPKFDDGYVTSSNSGAVRDKGYWGQIGGKDILLYGDTFACPGISRMAGAGTFTQQGTCSMGLRANTASLHPPTDPMTVSDFNLSTALGSTQWPSQFCDYEATWGETPECNGLGMVNVVAGPASNPNLGYTYYKLEARGCQAEHDICSGVAEVDASGDFPVCQRKQQCFWQSDEALFPGGAGTINGGDGYIYQYAGRGPPDYAVFVSRVPEGRAMDKSAYQWYHDDTQTWSSEPITASAPLSWAVMQDIADGQPMYSPFYKAFLYVGRTQGGLQEVDIRSAPTPVGPWSARTGFDDGNHRVAITPGNDGTYVYGIAPQPQFDTTGRTLRINYGPINPPNSQRTFVIEFCNPGDSDCVVGV